LGLYCRKVEIEADREVHLEAVKSPAEQRVLLRNVRWETYERLPAEREESRVPRFAYDRGMLEIMSPSTENEHGERTHQPHHRSLGRGVRKR